MEKYTTGWTTVHGNPLYPSTAKVQCDISYHDNVYEIDEVRVWDERGLFLAEQWDGFPIRGRRELMYGSRGIMPRHHINDGSAFWAQINNPWQPVNQAVVDEIWRFVKSFQ